MNSRENVHFPPFFFYNFDSHFLQFSFMVISFTRIPGILKLHTADFGWVSGSMAGLTPLPKGVVRGRGSTRKSVGFCPGKNVPPPLGSFSLSIFWTLILFATFNAIQGLKIAWNCQVELISVSRAVAGLTLLGYRFRTLLCPEFCVLMAKRVVRDAFITPTTSDGLQSDVCRLCILYAC